MTVIPCTPTSARSVHFTSSSLNGLMMDSIFFMGVILAALTLRVTLIVTAPSFGDVSGTFRPCTKVRQELAVVP